MLKINNLKVKSDSEKIINEVNLEIKRDETHILMGPNGSGKSTLAKAIMGHPSYEISRGDIEMKGEDITNLTPEKKARRGLFLGRQDPQEITGVPMLRFLQMARKEVKQKDLSPQELRSRLAKESESIGLDSGFLDRSLNKDFSGGEKKKSEVLQMSALEPNYIILDEIDSGIDIDSLKAIAEKIRSFTKKKGVLLITHYTRMLKLIDLDFVHVMKEGKIVKKGKAKLAEQIRNSGYKEF
ncbi:MAG: Fe-S cluster assembly ATPase SufC [Candidatus Magasanikbacteria bacterium]